MNCGSIEYSSGVHCLYTGEELTKPLDEALAAAVSSDAFGFALIYFSKMSCSEEDVVDLMRRSAPGLDYAACSTAGEITPHGLEQGRVIILLFPAKRFTFDACPVMPKSGGHIEEIAATVNARKEHFVAGNGKLDSTFALCLMDGISFMEEAVTAALYWGLDDVPLLGGSAGDGLDFKNTSLVLNGEKLDVCAILILVRTDLHLQIFKTDNFIPSQEKLVVTRSDPDHRIVHELNAMPAAQAYAEVIGSDPNALNPQSFASHPLVMRVGGEYYCRSIQKVNDDGSLSFFCAIDDGIVLTVAEQTGMARTTQEVLSSIDEKLGEIDFVLGFDCVLRQIDARNRQVTHKISKIYRDHRIVGFNTYGEQYRSMHLNQTLTGIAFGAVKNNPVDKDGRTTI